MEIERKLKIQINCKKTTGSGFIFRVVLDVNVHNILSDSVRGGKGCMPVSSTDKSNTVYIRF